MVPANRYRLGDRCIRNVRNSREATFYDRWCDVGRRERCFWMIPAKARNASFASPELGNAAATSGSRTTTVLPAANCDAYLLREARLKSYSGRISSASTWLTALPLLSDFFIGPTQH